MRILVAALLVACCLSALGLGKSQVASDTPITVTPSLARLHRT